MHYFAMVSGLIYHIMAIFGLFHHTPTCIVMPMEFSYARNKEECVFPNNVVCPENDYPVLNQNLQQVSRVAAVGVRCESTKICCLRRQTPLSSFASDNKEKIKFKIQNKSLCVFAPITYKIQQARRFYDSYLQSFLSGD